MDVILIRHAEAGERDAAQYPDDDKRPISPEGRKKQTTIARAMKRMGIEFDYLVTSPLDRAVQTAEVLAEVFGFKEAPTVSEALGHTCTPRNVLKLLAKFPPHETVALVGHEPAFSQVAAALVSPDGDLHIELKKSGVIGIGFPGAPELGKGTLLYLLKPGHLRKLKD
ncbi:MAG: SixA phosphatase family protein [Gemmatimonadales bacterium]